MGGGDKPMRLIAGQPMLAHVIARLARQCGPVALNANGNPARFAGFGLAVLPDTLPDQPGPLAGVLAGMDWAAGQGAQAVISVAGDTPFFPRDLALRLHQARGPSGLALAGGRDGEGNVTDHPVFGLWPVSLRDDLHASLMAGRRRVRDLTARHAPGLAVWDAFPRDPFFNVNTPEDLVQAEAWARSRA